MISKRLIECAKYAKGFDYIADIGCDHAYLAIYAVKNNYVKKAICYDINEGPIIQAKKNINKNNLSKFITATVADGISILDGLVDVVSICGMGGELIYDIIYKDVLKLKNVKRLILEPNVDVFMVRKLCELGFKIVNEEMIEDKGHIYEIIILERGSSNLDELDIKYGPILRRQKNELFINKYQKKLDNLNKNIKNIKDVDTLNKLEKEIMELNNIIK